MTKTKKPFLMEIISWLLKTVGCYQVPATMLLKEVIRKDVKLMAGLIIFPI